MCLSFHSICASSKSMPCFFLLALLGNLMFSKKGSFRKRCKKTFSIKLWHLRNAVWIVTLNSVFRDFKSILIEIFCEKKSVGQIFWWRMVNVWIANDVLTYRWEGRFLIRFYCRAGMIFGLAQAYIRIDWLRQSSMEVVALRCDPGSSGLCLGQWCRRWRAWCHHTMGTG